MSTNPGTEPSAGWCAQGQSERAKKVAEEEREEEKEEEEKRAVQ